jgi:hypothetical protein
LIPVSALVLAGVWLAFQPAGTRQGTLIRTPGRYDSPHKKSFVEFQTNEATLNQLSYRFGNSPSSGWTSTKSSTTASFGGELPLKASEWFAVWDRNDRLWLYTGYDIRWCAVMGNSVTGGNTWINWDEMPDAFARQLPPHARSDYERHMHAVTARQNSSMVQPSSASENQLQQTEGESDSAGKP